MKENRKKCGNGGSLIKVMNGRQLSTIEKIKNTDALIVQVEGRTIKNINKIALKY